MKTANPRVAALLSRKRFFLRAVSFLTSTAFLLTSVSGNGELWAQGLSIQGAAEVRGLGAAQDRFEVPSELGILRDYYKPAAPDAPFVLHIQDAHANVDAQKSIQGLLSWLSQKPGASGMTVFLEGASGEIHPEYLQLFKDYPEVNEAVVQDLSQKGELNGVELFAWTNFKQGISKQQADILGAEEISLYRDNLQTYREILFNQDGIETLAAPFRKQLEIAKSRILSPALRDFLKERDRRKLGNYQSDASSPQLSAYVTYLTAQARKELQLDLEDRFEQVRFPNLVRLLVLEKLEKSLNAESSAREMKKAVDVLSARAATDEERLMIASFEKMDASVDARRIAESVWGWASAKNVDLRSYSEMWKSVGSIVLRSEVKGEALFEEMETIENWLLETWMTSESEKRLLGVILDFENIEKLLTLKWTPADEEAFLARSEALLESVFGETLSLLLNENGEGGALSRYPLDKESLRAEVDRALSFYETARERDQVILDNTLASGDESRLKVLVSGGFHTTGLTRLLRENEIGYAVIQPVIRRNDNGELYRNVLKEKNSDVTAYFHEPVLSKQEAVYFKAYMETAAPLLWEKYKVPHSEIGSKLAEAMNAHPVLESAVTVTSEAEGAGSRLEVVPSLISETPANVQDQAVALAAITGEPEVFKSSWVTTGGTSAAADVKPEAVSTAVVGINPAGTGISISGAVTSRRNFLRQTATAAAAVALSGTAAEEALAQQPKLAQRIVQRRLDSAYAARVEGTKPSLSASTVEKLTLDEIAKLAEYYGLNLQPKHKSKAGAVAPVVPFGEGYEPGVGEGPEDARNIQSEDLWFRIFRDSKRGQTADSLRRQLFIQKAIMATADDVVGRGLEPLSPLKQDEISQLARYIIGLDKSSPYAVPDDASPARYFDPETPQHQFLRTIVRALLLNTDRSNLLKFPDYNLRLVDYKHSDKPADAAPSKEDQIQFIYDAAALLGLSEQSLTAVNEFTMGDATALLDIWLNKPQVEVTINGVKRMLPNDEFNANMTVGDVMIALTNRKRVQQIADDAGLSMIDEMVRFRRSAEQKKLGRKLTPEEIKAIQADPYTRLTPGDISNFAKPFIALDTEMRRDFQARSAALDASLQQAQNDAQRLAIVRDAERERQRALFDFGRRYTEVLNRTYRDLSKELVARSSRSELRAAYEGLPQRLAETYHLERLRAAYDILRSFEKGAVTPSDSGGGYQILTEIGAVGYDVSMEIPAALSVVKDAIEFSLARPRSELRSEQALEDALLLEGVGESTPDWQRLNVVAAVILQAVSQRPLPVKLQDIQEPVMAALNAQGIGVNSTDVENLVNRLVMRGYLRKVEDGYDLAVRPEVFAVKFSDVGHIQSDFENALDAFISDKQGPSAKKLGEMIEDYSRVIRRWPLYPVEARWPILKALALLTPAQQAAVVEFLDARPALRRSYSLVDSVLLMLKNEIPENWLEVQAPNLTGRRVYYVSPETWLAAGGLGRVGQYHTVMAKQLAGSKAQVVTIEPYYPFTRNAQGQEVPIDYSKTPVPVEGLSAVPLMEFEVSVKGRQVKAQVFKGTNQYGMEVYLVKDVGDYYTRLLYRYGPDFGTASWEEFTEFYTRASGEIFARLEAQEFENKKDAYKAPVLWANDGQSALLMLLARKMLDEMPASAFKNALKKYLLWMTTHTYRNRGYYGKAQMIELLQSMGIPQKYWQYALAITDGNFTSTGTRVADGSNAVAAVHRDEVAYIDPFIRLLGITNGDDRTASRSVFDGIFQELFPGENSEFPTAQQVVEVKKIAKTRMGLNPEQPVISYSGRLVEEKAGRERAFTDANLTALVRAGAQVIIYGNVQSHTQWMFDQLTALASRINPEGPGKLIVRTGWGIPEQRELLAATDLQMQDSDRGTGASEYTEADVSANAGLQSGAPWIEGIIQRQGIIVDRSQPGVGNTLIPHDASPQAYLNMFQWLIDNFNQNRLELGAYQAASVRISRVLDAKITSAEYLRQISRALERKENPLDILRRFIGGEPLGQYFQSEWLRADLIGAAAESSATQLKPKQEGRIQAFGFQDFAGRPGIVTVLSGVPKSQDEGIYEFFTDEGGRVVDTLFNQLNLKMTDKVRVVNAATGEKYGVYSGSELKEELSPAGRGFFVGLSGRTPFQVLHFRPYSEELQRTAPTTGLADRRSLFFDDDASTAVRDEILSLVPPEAIAASRKTANDLVVWTPVERFQPRDKAPKSWSEKGLFLVVNKGEGHLNLTLAPTTESIWDPSFRNRAATDQNTYAQIQLEVTNNHIHIGIGRMSVADFQKWYQTQLKPFAVRHGFGAVQIHQGNLSPEILTANGFTRIRERTANEAALWEAPVRSELRTVDGFNIEDKVALDGLNPEQRRVLDLLISEGQTQLFEPWTAAGTDEEKKRAFLDQASELDRTYPGGLAAYRANAVKLLTASAKGENPLAGFSPAVPELVDLTKLNADFEVRQEQGLAGANKLAFVMVAGGLGERLGYDGIKIAIPQSLLTGQTYAEWYGRNIKAFQDRANAENGETAQIPFVIMTSNDTDARTRELLTETGNLGLAADQIKIVKQGAVPALVNNNADFVAETDNPYELQTKPHGHGDVHMLIHRDDLAKQWKAQGVTHVVFIQDTNGQVFNSVLPGLTVSQELGLDMNFFTVPRDAGEAAGAITKLTHTDGRVMVGNVEYNQLGPLLKATVNPAGDVSDTVTGFSPYPGNLNVFAVELGAYLELLDQTQGVIQEFINPKYADETKTKFKSPTRSETMMQDAAFAMPGKVGATNFDKRTVFSPVKNNLADGAAKRDAMATGESDFYKGFRRQLEAAGVQVSVVGPERVTRGVKYEDGAKVVLDPSFAVTQTDVREKVQGGSISNKSSLVVEGSGVKLENLNLNGALKIRAVPGANVVIRNLTVENEGSVFVDLTDEEMADDSVPAYLKIRGYQLEVREEVVISITAPGNYVLDGETISGPAVITGTDGVSLVRSELRTVDGFNIEDKVDLDGLNPEQRRALDLLVTEKQTQLFELWAAAGTDEEKKRAFLDQVAELDKTYPGGLAAYRANAAKLLAAAAESKDPFEGYTPAVPELVDLTKLNADFEARQEQGLAAANKLAFVMVAGGLGERLGYDGIKIAIPQSLLTGQTYAEWYGRNIKAFQGRANAENGESVEIPFVIMTSNDTDARTRELLTETDNLGLAADQIKIVKQGAVPALVNNNADFVTETDVPYELQTKPHGHGDVHMLIHRDSLAKQWKAQGVTHVVFIQDTNGQVFNSVLPGLTVSQELGLDMNFFTVPRDAREAAGAITKLTRTDGRVLVGNVEYNQLDPLLKATVNPAGDVADPVTGYSPYPGNLNVFALELDAYLALLDQTQGVIQEFINPKYADEKKTKFKSPTRLETMMQDAAFAMPGKVGATNFDKRTVFSPVKNNLTDGAVKRDAMATGEADFYKGFRRQLEAAGVDITVAAPERVTRGITYEDGAKVVLDPSFAVTQTDVRDKVRGGSITNRSSLVVEGPGVKLQNLNLNGALKIRAVPGANVVIRNLTVENEGSVFVDLTDEEMADDSVPAYLKIRGYRLEVAEEVVINITEPGNYVLENVQILGGGRYESIGGQLKFRSELRSESLTLSARWATFRQWGDLDRALSRLYREDKKSVLGRIYALVNFEVSQKRDAARLVSEKLPLLVSNVVKPNLILKESREAADKLDLLFKSLLEFSQQITDSTLVDEIYRDLLTNRQLSSMNFDAFSEYVSGLPQARIEQRKQDEIQRLRRAKAELEASARRQRLEGIQQKLHADAVSAGIQALLDTNRELRVVREVIVEAAEKILQLEESGATAYEAKFSFEAGTEKVTVQEYVGDVQIGTETTPTVFLYPYDQVTEPVFGPEYKDVEKEVPILKLTAVDVVLGQPRSELRDLADSSEIAVKRDLADKFDVALFPETATDAATRPTINRVREVLASAPEAFLPAEAREVAEIATEAVLATADALAAQLGISREEALTAILVQLLPSETVDSAQWNIVMGAARQELGDALASRFIDDTGDNPYHFQQTVTAADLSRDEDQTMIAFTLLSRKQHRMTFFIPPDDDDDELVSPDQLDKLLAAIKEKIRRLGGNDAAAKRLTLIALPSGDEGQVRKAMIRETQGVNGDLYNIVLHRTRTFLEAFGVVKGLSRVDRGQVGYSEANYLAGALLGQKDYNELGIFDLQNEMRRLGYSEEVVQRISRMIQALQKIAAAA